MTPDPKCCPQCLHEWSGDCLGCAWRRIDEQKAELEAMRAVVEAARKAEAIYWNFEVSMKSEIEALGLAIKRLDALTAAAERGRG